MMLDEKPNDPWRDPAFEAAVRETAYFLWEQDGRPLGKETDYWYQALERTLRERNADKNLGASPSVTPTGQVDDNLDDLGRPLNH